MSGAEALAVIGLISSIITIFETSKNLFDAATSAKGLHEAFRVVAQNVPLVLSILHDCKRIQEQADRDYVATVDSKYKKELEESAKAVKPIILVCEENALELKDIFEKVVPGDHASSFDRYKKAAQAIMPSKKHKVESLMKTILEKLQLLHTKQFFKTISENRSEKLEAASQQLAQLAPSLPEVDNRQSNSIKDATFHADQDIHHDRDKKRSTSQSTRNSDIDFLRSLGTNDMNVFIGRYMAEHVDGTCSWLLKHDTFRKWQASSSSCILWFVGEAGTGKTVLTSFLASTIMTDESSVFSSPSSSGLVDSTCFFFCNQNDKMLSGISAIVNGLLAQIMDQYHDIIPHVRKKFESVRGMTAQSAWTLFTRTTENVEFGSLYILLDAIDECDDKSRNTLIKMMEQLVSSQIALGEGNTKRIKVFITSRPFAIDHSPSRYLLTAEDCSQAVKEDISKIVEDQISELVLNEVCNKEDAKRLKDDLLLRAEGCVLWVRLILDEVKNRIALKSEDLPDLLKGIPGGLDSAFTELLPRISFKEDNDQLLKRILGFICVSYRPLTLKELNLLLSTNGNSTSRYVKTGIYSGMRGTLKKLLGPLVKISQDRVSFIHASVKEFFVSLDDKHKLFKTHAVDKQVAQIDLARSCVDYLMLDAFCQDLQEENTTIAHSDDEQEAASSPGASTLSSTISSSSDLSSDSNHQTGMLDFAGVGLFDEPDTDHHPAWSMISDRFPAYDFAAKFWHQHVRLISNEHMPQALVERAHILLDTRSGFCRNWMRYLRSEGYLALPKPTLSNDLSTAAAVGCENLLMPDLVCQATATEAQDALLWAITCGQVRTIQYFLKHVTSVEFDMRDTTPLLTAVETGNIECVRTLVLVGLADINRSNTMGQTPLILAASAGQETILNFLLKQKHININFADRQGRTALIEAAAVGSKACVVALLARGGIITNVTDKKGRTALSYAAEEGWSPIVKTLLEHDRISVNIKDSRGRQPLSYAAGRGHKSIVERLLKNNASLDGDEDGRNAISWAVSSRKAIEHKPSEQSLLELLISKASKNVATPDKYGWDAMFWAIHSPVYMDATRILIQSNKMDINARDSNQRTLLSWVAAQNLHDLLQLLLEQPGCKIDVPDSDGRTPLLWAAGSGDRGACTILLDHGANRALVDHRGRTFEDWLSLGGISGSFVVRRED